MNIIRQATFSAIFGLCAVAALGFNGDANGLRTADAATIDCKIGEARFACSTPQWGYPAGDLIIWDAL
jgi:hypothetical protein